MTRLWVAAVLIVGCVSFPAGASRPGDGLTAAKDLYAAARYDEALDLLNGLRADERADRRSVEQYRALCLLALGRIGEADTAIGAVVSADPLYRPTESEASPRVRATFTDVRRRLLPEIATERYLAAKAAYDRAAWSDAERQFRLVLSLLDDAEMGGRLADLRTLASGFAELSTSAAAPPPPAEAAAPLPPPAPVPDPERIYASEDDGIVPPVVVRQDIPSIPSSAVATAKARGVLEVVVDEQGRVVAMAIRMSVHPAFDAQLLAAARDWKYLPAAHEGRPVKFRKLIQINVAR